MTHEPVITCDPRRQFGDACVAGTRIPAHVLAGLHWAGDGVDQIADWYDVDRLDVLWCCAWWVLTGQLKGRRGKRVGQWHLWMEHAITVLGGHEDGPLCDPDEYEAPL